MSDQSNKRPRYPTFRYWMDTTWDANLDGAPDILENIRTEIGLENVDNTSDMNKPVSTATQTALDSKQNTLVSGTTLKTVNNATLLGPGNVAITKSDVGLANVDNTSDVNKPVSTATQTALNSKQNVINGAQFLTLSTNDGNGSDGGFGINYVINSNGHVIGEITGNYKTSEAGGLGGMSFNTRNYGVVSPALVVNGGGDIEIPRGKLITSGFIQQTPSGFALERQIGVTRLTDNTTQSGQLRVIAGATQAATTNSNGPSLILSGGVSTGTGISSINFVNYGPGVSGATDNTAITRMTLKGEKLGLSTVDPAAKMHITGATNAGSGMVVQGGDFGGGIGAMYAQGGGFAQKFVISARRSTNGTPANDLYDTSSWTPSDILLNPDGGNVGIGTANPKTRLHVTALPEYLDNEDALANGLTNGAFYRTGQLLKVALSSHNGGTDFVGTPYIRIRPPNNNQTASALLRNDGSDFYILSTDVGNVQGGWNSNRFFSFNFATGNTFIGNSNYTVNPKTIIYGDVILDKAQSPASPTTPGTKGTITYDANYMYICTAANTWRRIALSTW